MERDPGGEPAGTSGGQGTGGQTPETQRPKTWSGTGEGLVTRKLTLKGGRVAGEQEVGSKGRSRQVRNPSRIRSRTGLVSYGQSGRETLEGLA